MGVNRVNVLQELVSVFYLLDNKNITHIPFCLVLGVGRCVDGPDFKVFHEEVGNDWAYG